MFDCGEVTEQASAWACRDLASCSDEELFEAVVAAEQARSLWEATCAHLLAELDARDACDTTFGMRTAAWVAREAGVAPGPVKQRLRVGRVLRERFDVIDEAVSAGTPAVEGGLSFDHARVLAEVTNPRIASAVADLQHEIVALAQGCTFEQWKNQVRCLVELLDADGTEPDDLDVNKLTVIETIDGLTHLQGTLTAGPGLAVRAALDAKADELHRRFTRDHDTTPDIDIPPRATLMALALAELLQIATGAEPGAGSVPRAEVTLVLHDHQTTDTDGRPLPPATARVWGCDPELWSVIVDDMGVPLDAGHTRRLATAAQRRAIAVRDGGCTFPGCDAPIAWTDLHHLQHWQDGGTTDEDNLAALCRHHHVVVHRPGWTTHLTPDRWCWWQTPSGHTLWGQQHRRRRTDPPPTRCPGCHGCTHERHEHDAATERAGPTRRAA